MLQDESNYHHNHGNYNDNYYGYHEYKRKYDSDNQHPSICRTGASYPKVDMPYGGIVPENRRKQRIEPRLGAVSPAALVSLVWTGSPGLICALMLMLIDQL